MGSKVLTRRRGKKYEYRFESASVAAASIPPARHTPPA